MKFLYPILTLFLFSCGVNEKIARKLRRADRLTKEAIALGAEVKDDTVYQERVIKGDSTVIHIPFERVIRKDSLQTVYQDRIRIQYRLIHDTLQVKVECPPDTIRVPVTVHKSIICPTCPRDRMWKGIGIGAGGILLLLILLGLVRLIKP